MYRIVIFTLIGYEIVNTVSGHGMLLNPVARGSRWRYDPQAPINYDDNQLFCGGFRVQWSLNDGRCGLCGDDYRDPTPRQHENGGFYGRGVIVKSYKSGSLIPVSVYITANHLGYFIYDLCNLSSEKSESDQCFFRNKLRIFDRSDRYRVPNSSIGWFNTTVQLPPGVTCKHCVLRWTYNTGNSWGTCDDGSGALGCGEQEHFRGCADISIVDSQYRIEEDPEVGELDDDLDVEDEVDSFQFVDNFLRGADDITDDETL